MTSIMLRVLLALSIAVAASAQDWPQWRGPLGNGVNPEARGLPVTWSETENVQWKLALPSWAAATPIVSGDTVFVTSAEAGSVGHAGSGGGAADKERLLLLAVDRETGKIRWSRVMGVGNRLGRKQNMASPSPVTDGTTVWTTTGNGELAAWDFSGKELWRRDLQKDYGKFGIQFGYGSSPLLIEGKLYMQVLHGMYTDDPSYVLALDGKTGKTLWRTERPTDAQRETPDSYSTPTRIEVGGRRVILTAGAGYLTGHDAETGRELWRAGGLNPQNAGNYRTIASALVVDDLVLTPSRRRPFIAFRVDEKAERVWSTEYGPDVPTPVSDGERLYIIDDKGIVLCLRVKDGSVVYDRTRIEPGTYSASPILADGKIYAISEDGSTTVLAAGGEFRTLAVNKLDGYTLASPAAAGDQLFIRTAETLYCLSTRGGRAD